MTLAAAAAGYLNEGLAIIALSGKAPNPNVHQRGLNQAMVGKPEDEGDLELLRYAFGRDDTTGIGIVIQPGMAVVDIDGEKGLIALCEMLDCTVDRIPATRTASTGRGIHLYYATAGEVRTTKLADKLDLKGVGGYVVAPPSLHPDGRTYKWLDPDVQYEWLPDAIVSYVASRPAPAAKPKRQQAVLRDGKWVMEDAPATMAGLAAAMSEAKEGERNNMLNWAAFTAWQEGFDFDEVMEVIGKAAEKAGLSHAEVNQTVRSAFNSRG